MVKKKPQPEAESGNGWQIVSSDSPKETADAVVSDDAVSDIGVSDFGAPDLAVPEVGVPGADSPGEGQEGWQDPVQPLSLDEIAAAEEEKPRTSDVSLVSIGILMGVYALYTVAWFLAAKSYSLYYSVVVTSSGIVGDILYQALIWLTAVTPAIWFLVSFQLTKGKAPWKRIAWLVAGAIVLIPIPYLFQQVIY